MIRRITMLVAAALLALALAAPAAFAAPPAQEECEAAGGTYTRVGPGQYECVIVTESNPGNPQSGEAATPFTQEESTTQPGQGTGAGETSPSNPNFSEDTGPVTNPGGGTPPGQQ